MSVLRPLGVHVEEPKLRDVYDGEARHHREELQLPQEHDDRVEEVEPALASVLPVAMQGELIACGQLPHDVKRVVEDRCALDGVDQGLEPQDLCLGDAPEGLVDDLDCVTDGRALRPYEAKPGEAQHTGHCRTPEILRAAAKVVPTAEEKCGAERRHHCQNREGSPDDVGSAQSKEAQVEDGQADAAPSAGSKCPPCTPKGVAEGVHEIDIPHRPEQPEQQEPFVLAGRQA
mmetsp:Transcript_125513/g.349385  ORF Transcript_125513/g.349385 Transcript_125513/m.349385 type:complete len:231 (-) Transcript_125513:662-1354(-)